MSRSKQNRPGQKKCKGDRRVKGSEDKERDRPQEPGCWSAVRVQEMGWSQREKGKQLLYPAQPQRWGQHDPDSFPSLYLGAYSAQTQCVANRGLLLLFCSLLCLLCLIFALSLVLALFHFPAELFQCAGSFWLPLLSGDKVTHGQEWPGVGGFQWEGLCIFHGLLWGPGPCISLLGQLPGHRRTGALARNPTFIFLINIITTWRYSRTCYTLFCLT